jgi:hypothetical protein
VKARYSMVGSIQRGHRFFFLWDENRWAFAFSGVVSGISRPYTLVLVDALFFRIFDSRPSLLKSNGMLSSVRIPSATRIVTH